MKDHVEYQIFNAKGRLIHVFDDRKIAEKRIADFGIGCQLVEVRKTFTVLKTNKAKIVPIQAAHTGLAMSA